MKLLILIAVTCMFARISGQSDTVESLTQQASDLFKAFTSKQSNVNSDVIYNYLSSQLNALNTKISDISSQRVADLTAARSNALDQLAQSEANWQQTSSSDVVNLCSSTVSIDLDLIINLIVDSFIRFDQMYFQYTLGNLESNTHSSFYNTDFYTAQYNNAINGDNVTAESLQAYIDSLQILISNLQTDAKAKADQVVARLQKLVVQFEDYVEERAQYFQTVLSNINDNFNTCVANN